MNKNIFKKFIVLFSLGFVLFGFNFVLADNIPPVTINLKIYSGSTVLFNGPLIVTACPESTADTAPITVNGKCAVEQSGLSNTWTWQYTPSGWLNQLGTYTTTPDFSKSWGWFNNLNYGNTALNQHILSNGEELLLTYNSFPLRISASKNSGIVGDTITFTAEEESTFDANYNMIWTKSLGTTITLGAKSCVTIADGTCSIVLDTAGSFNAIGNKDLYVPSNNLSIEVQESVSHSSGGNYIKNFVMTSIFPTKEKTFSVENALKFLEINQKSDGSYNAPMYTDWVAVAIGVGDDKEIESKLINYLKENNVDSSVVTDNERHAMALMSLGINPYSGTSINYIKKITDSFDGAQFGDKTFINDDIFALIVLKNAGYSVNDELITKDLGYIISKQDKDGSWGSIDMTAAGIQALKSFENIAGVNDAILKAEKYITTNQKTDGGFENTSSTSWVLQTLFDDKEILKGEDYLVSKQDIDGGMESVGTDLSIRIWETAYAIPAILHKSWNTILNNFPKPDISTVTLNKSEVIKQNKKIDPKISNINNGEVIKSTEDKKKIENIIDNNGEVKVSKYSNIWHVISAPFSWLLGKLGF